MVRLVQRRAVVDPDIARQGFIMRGFRPFHGISFVIGGGVVALEPALRQVIHEGRRASRRCPAPG